MSCPWKTNAHRAGIKFLGIVRVRLRGGILSFSALLGLAFGAWALLMGRSYPHFFLRVNSFSFCQISYAILACSLRLVLAVQTPEKSSDSLSGASNQNRGFLAATLSASFSGVESGAETNSGAKSSAKGCQACLAHSCVSSGPCGLNPIARK